MSNLLDTITTQLRHYTHQETIALVRDFLVGLDEREQVCFLQSLRNAIANDVYVEHAIGGRDRYHYARAGAFCTVIRSIRRMQGREADFERYYQGLFATYSRLSALKDELRKAIRG